VLTMGVGFPATVVFYKITIQYWVRIILIKAEYTIFFSNKYDPIWQTHPGFHKYIFAFQQNYPNKSPSVLLVVFATLGVKRKEEYVQLPSWRKSTMRVTSLSIGWTKFAISPYSLKLVTS
jgi:hypothetical protein